MTREVVPVTGVECIGCEGNPAPENNPCAVCGQARDGHIDRHDARTGQCDAWVAALSTPGEGMREALALPDVMPGHWDTDGGREMAESNLRVQDRGFLTKGDMSDLALANAVYLASRQDLDLIVWQTAAKERIRWLSAHLAAALATPAPVPATREGWLRQALDASLAKRSVATMDPPWTTAFNAALDMVARDTSAPQSDAGDAWRTDMEGALRLAHSTLHECTAVLTADDCAKVADVMAIIREVLPAPTAASETK